ncbi:MAG: type II secretion system F family protein [Candidatus Nanopelagicales bacterium]
MLTILAALSAAVAGWMLWSPPVAPPPLPAPTPTSEPRAGLVGTLIAHPRLVALGAGLSVLILLGGWLGVGLGGLVAVASPLAIQQMEPRAVRTRRVALVRDAPLVADLIGAAMLAGIPLERTLLAVAGAVGGPASDVLRGLHLRLELGVPPEQAWAAVSREPGLESLGRAAARSARTGAPLAEILLATGAALREAAVAAAAEQVHAAGVRAVIPLGLCLLPAFLLLGVVPMVASLLAGFF